MMWSKVRDTWITNKFKYFAWSDPKTLPTDAEHITQKTLIRTIELRTASDFLIIVPGLQFAAKRFNLNSKFFNSIGFN